MASEIVLVIWTDAAADASTAHQLAAETAASIRRSTGLAADVAAFSAREIGPGDPAAAAEAFAAAEAPADEVVEPKKARKPRAKKPAAEAS